MSSEKKKIKQKNVLEFVLHREEHYVSGELWGGFSEHGCSLGLFFYIALILSLGVIQFV